jgi:hypothetical protein
MPYDIEKAISANDIKNGSVVTNTLFTGRSITYNYYVKNTPTLTNIQSKYIDRFDDPSYYYGNGVQGSGHL